MGWTGKDRTGQDRTGKWAGHYNTCSLEIQPVDRFTWTMVQERQETRQDRAGIDRTGKWAGQYNTWSLEIQPVDRLTWTMASTGRRQDRTGQDRTGQGWKMGWTIQYLEPGDPAS